MKRKLIVILAAVGMMALVVNMSNVWDVLTQFTPSPDNNAEEKPSIQLGEVLGQSTGLVASWFNAARPILEGATRQAVESVGQIEVNDQKIELDKAFESVKQRASHLPEEALLRARYEYCQQVVLDYERE